MSVAKASAIACEYITPFKPIILGNSKISGINTMPCLNEFKKTPANALPIDKYSVEYEN